MDINYCTTPWGQLVREVLAVPLIRVPDGSGHGHFNSAKGWIRGLSNVRIRLGETYPLISQTVDELSALVHHYEVKQVLINKLDPGAELSPHRDGYPQYDRYHLPIVSNKDAYWWDEYDGKRVMLERWWYGPVPYCGILHGAGNPGDSDRIHLVVDYAHEKGK